MSSAGRDPGAGIGEHPQTPTSWGQLLSAYLHAGLWVGLLGGAFIGAALGTALARLGTISLVLETGSERLAALAFLTALAALLGAAATGVAALLGGAVARLSVAARRRMHPWRFSLAALGIGVATVFTFFYVAFDVVRDMGSGLGLATLAGFTVVPPVLLVLLGSSRPRHAPVAPPRVSAAGAAALLLLLLLAAATVDWALPRLQAAEGRAPAAVSGSGGGTAPTATASAARPRGSAVVLISIDTLRADHLGAYGYRRDTSPALDALARDGMLFERAHSEAPWTLPSHASLLTGLYPWVNGACFTDNLRFLNSETADRLSSEEVTLAERLEAAGYRTAGFTSLKWLGPTFGLDQGFQTFQLNSQRIFGQAIIDQGLAWLGGVHGEPFFLFLHLADVHEYRSTDAIFRRYYRGEYHGKLAAHPEKTVADAWQSVTPEDLRWLEARYDAAIDYTDSQLGRFFDALKARGLYDGALIIVTADHGEEFLDHGGTGHGFQLYEEDLHVPLIVKPPRGFRVAQPRSDASVGLVDVVPTVLDYLHLPPAPGLDGTSLRPLVDGGSLSRRTLYAGCSLLQNRFAALAGRSKYIANRVPPFGLFQLARWMPNLRAFYKFEPPELYDLVADPHETRNLSASRPAAAARLRSQLLAELARDRRSGTSVRLDAKTVEQLRALGYMH